QHFVVDGVETLRAVEREDADGTLAFEDDRVHAGKSTVRTGRPDARSVGTDHARAGELVVPPAMLVTARHGGKKRPEEHEHAGEEPPASPARVRHTPAHEQDDERRKPRHEAHRQHCERGWPPVLADNRKVQELLPERLPPEQRWSEFVHGPGYHDQN